MGNVPYLQTGCPTAFSVERSSRSHPSTLAPVDGGPSGPTLIKKEMTEEVTKSKILACITALKKLFMHAWWYYGRIWKYDGML
ncbi:hypothetical protein Scep_028119 [Stephania cephalantha]|uniref:Uncharacterized protein n=1 Tax=Stephania cephalantha TaxID=152367 RepID=A0AAP0HLH0_9MAGN